MKYKVIQDFPGLSIGDTLTLNGDFYTSTSREVDIAEGSETVYIGSTVLGKDVVEGNSEFFTQLNNIETAIDPRLLKLDEMGQVAAVLEADLVTAMNEYHHDVLQRVIGEVYNEINLLAKFVI